MLYLMLGKFHLHTIWSKFTSGRMCASSTTIYFAVNCDFIFKFQPKMENKNKCKLRQLVAESFMASM